MRLIYISNRQAIDHYMQDIVDNDDQPPGKPGRRVGPETCFTAFGPGCAPRPGPVLEPGNIARQVPAIDNEVRATNDGERIRVLRNQEERQQIEAAVDKGGKRASCLLARHPLALQQVVADRVGKELICSKHLLHFSVIIK